METQGISVDSQVLIDASNTLKVNAFFSSLMEQFVIMNLNYFKNFWRWSRESFSLFFFFADENTKGRRRGPQGKVEVW